MKHLLIFLLVEALTMGTTEGQTAAPPFYEDKRDLLTYKDEAGKSRAISTAEGWTKRRAHILANMQQVMGAHPDRSSLPDLVELGQKNRFPAADDL